jgi:hypothetical protein
MQQVSLAGDTEDLAYNASQTTKARASTHKLLPTPVTK